MNKAEMYRLNLSTKLLQRLNEIEFTAIGYAIFVWCGKFEGTISEMMQRALNFVERWRRKESLSVNPQRHLSYHSRQRQPF